MFGRSIHLDSKEGERERERSRVGKRRGNFELDRKSEEKAGWTGKVFEYFLSAAALSAVWLGWTTNEWLTVL